MGMAAECIAGGSAVSVQTKLAGCFGLALLLGQLPGCAGGVDDIGSGFDTPDAAPVVNSDAGAIADASAVSQDAATPTAKPDAAVDSGMPLESRDGSVEAAVDAAAVDAALGDAALGDAATMPMVDAGPGPSEDAGPSTDAQTDAGDLLSVCTGGKVGTDSSKLTANSAYGSVEFWLPPANQITRLQTTLLVPEEPTTRGTLFLWPGLQPLRGQDPGRVGNGVLQPVLTWGPSCAPKKPASYDAWWISGMYVNVTTNAAGPTGCAGGNAMNVAVGDDLRMDMRLMGTTWTQTIVNEQNDKTVDFAYDLKGQYQNRAIFDIELVSSTKPTEDVVFLDSILSFASPASTCQPNQRGPTDYFSAPTLSPDGLHCCYGKIVLRARGVAATTPDRP